MYIYHILKGLSYLHDDGMIYRDIKATDLLSDSNNVTKLVDFGVSTKVNNSTMA